MRPEKSGEEKKQGAFDLHLFTLVGLHRYNHKRLQTSTKQNLKESISQVSVTV